MLQHVFVYSRLYHELSRGSQLCANACAFLKFINRTSYIPVKTLGYKFLLQLLKFLLRKWEQILKHVTYILKMIHDLQFSCQIIKKYSLDEPLKQKLLTHTAQDAKVSFNIAQLSLQNKLFKMKMLLSHFLRIGKLFLKFISNSLDLVINLLFLYIDKIHNL